MLPPQTPQTGHPAKDHRRVLNGILWVRRTGAPWREAPPAYGPAYGPWQTRAPRCSRGVKAGRWDQILAALPRQGDAQGAGDGALHHGDGRVSRAPPAGGGGAQKGCRAPARRRAEARGRSPGGFSTTIPLRAQGQGQPLTLLSTAGQRTAQTVFDPLLESGAVKRAGRGRPRSRPPRVGGAKGYRRTHSRRSRRQRGSGVVIPRRAHERRRGRCDTTAYRQRPGAERLVNRLKQFRRIATRDEKRAVNYRGLLTLAAIMLWL